MSDENTTEIVLPRSFKSPDALDCWEETPLPPFDLDGVRYAGVRPAQFAERWPEHGDLLAALQAASALAPDPYDRGPGLGKADHCKPHWLIAAEEERAAVEARFSCDQPPA